MWRRTGGFHRAADIKGTGPVESCGLLTASVDSTLFWRRVSDALRGRYFVGLPVRIKVRHRKGERRRVTDFARHVPQRLMLPKPGRRTCDEAT
jgi:hypothetical protein